MADFLKNDYISCDITKQSKVKQSAMTKVSRVSESTKYDNQIIGCFDIGKNKQYVYAKTTRGSEMKVFSFTNNATGFKECYEQLELFKKQECLSDITLGIESTGSYGEALCQWMVNKGIKMVGVNPKHVHRIKEVLDNSPLKSDKKDPKVGTQLIELGSYHELIQVQGVAGELRELTKFRRQLKIKETRITNQVESQVVRVFPEFYQVIKSLGHTALYILEHYPLPKDIVKLGYDSLLETMKKKSAYQWREEKATALLNAATQSIGITEGEVAISLSIKGLVEQLLLIRKQIKDTEDILKNLLDEHDEAQILLSMPQIGVITASEIIGETGGISKYSNAEKLIKLAGLNLYEISSGKHFGRKRITKRGRANLRQSLYNAALRMIKTKGIYREQYERHLSKGMKKPQAVVAISKKILRVLFSMIKNKQNFDCTFVVQKSGEQKRTKAA